MRDFVGDFIDSMKLIGFLQGWERLLELVALKCT